MAKKKKRNKKQKSPSPAIVMGLLAVSIICIILFLVTGSGPSKKMADQNKCFNIYDSESAAIVLNGTVLEAQGKVMGDQIYITYDTVWNYINSGFYFEDGVLYLTIPSGTKQWTEGDGSGTLCIEGEDVYISVRCIAENSDLELNIFEEPNRVVIRNQWKDLKEATVLEETQVRQRPDEKSDIAVNSEAEEKVILLETEDRWSHVITGDGHEGYVKTEALSEAAEVVHEPDPTYLFDSVKYQGTVKMAWHYIDSFANNQYLDGMMADTHGLNVISPTWFGFNDLNGNIYSYADAEYMSKAHDTYGLSVWGMISDYTGEDGSTGDILKNSNSRKNCIDQLMEQALTYGLDGINIDFETIRVDQAAAFLQFLRELTTAAHKSGIIVSVDNYVPTFTAQYKRAEQNKIVDYVVIMGYDEHTGASTEIGSVASIGFVENGVIDTLKEVAPEKTILGVPFYTKGWWEPYGSAEFGYKNLDMTEEQGFIDEHNIEIYWDENLGQNVGSADGDDARYTIWVEDAQSMAKKLELISKYGLAGASGWRIGTETVDIWNVWDQYLNS